jgi:hypothetical protein
MEKALSDRAIGLTGTMNKKKLIKNKKVCRVK